VRHFRQREANEPLANPKFPFGVNQALDFAVGFPLQSGTRPYGICRRQLRAATGILKPATKAPQNHHDHGTSGEDEHHDSADNSLSYGCAIHLDYPPAKHDDRFRLSLTRNFISGYRGTVDNEPCSFEILAGGWKTRLGSILTRRSPLFSRPFSTQI